MAISYSEVRYKNFGRCLKIENAFAEVYVTLDIGPRVIRYALRGGANFFFEDRARAVFHDEKAMSDYYGRGAAWYIYGGHRIWISPESLPRCYYPDNTRVRYEITDAGVTFTPAPQRKNGVAMELTVALEEYGTQVTVTNSVTNIADEPQEFAVWALSVLTPGGLEIIPQNRHNTGLLGNRVMALWPYTDMSDKRVSWGKEYITLRQDKRAQTAFKLGMDNRRGWAAYAYRGALFIKRLPFVEDAVYPDGGMNFETYTCANFLEMESLSPLRTVEPGKRVDHVETWCILDDVKAPRPGDFAAVTALVNRLIE